MPRAVEQVVVSCLAKEVENHPKIGPRSGGEVPPRRREGRSPVPPEGGPGRGRGPGGDRRGNGAGDRLLAVGRRDRQFRRGATARPAGAHPSGAAQGVHGEERPEVSPLLARGLPARRLRAGQPEGPGRRLAPGPRAIGGLEADKDGRRSVIRIPRGEPRWGDRELDAVQANHPPHKVTLSSFYMQERESRSEVRYLVAKYRNKNEENLEDLEEQARRDEVDRARRGRWASGAGVTWVTAANSAPP